MSHRIAIVCLILLVCITSWGQVPTNGNILPATASIPRMIRFSGQLKGVSGTVGITFTLHKSQADEAVLWTETQNVKLDGDGKYTVLLGSTKADGLPTELFASAEAQWLGVRVEGRTPQARVLLVSVPYAMKAAEAETLAGKPLSAFVLAGPNTPRNSEGISYLSDNSASGATPNVTSGGPGYIGKFNNTTDIGNSAIFQSGIKIGVNTTTPAGGFHVVSTSLIAGLFESYSGDPAIAPNTPMFQRSSRGTLAAPAALTTNEMMGGFLAGGSNGTGITTTRAGLLARAAEPWTATANGTYLSFFTTNTGAAVFGEAMRITANGNVGIGTVAPTSKLTVNGTANFTGPITFAPGQTFPGTQNRISGACAPGYFMQAVNIDGGVVCAPAAGSGTVTSVTAAAGSGLNVTNPNTMPQIATDFTVIQARLTSSCPNGQTLQGVDAAGNPTCVSSTPSGSVMIGNSPVPPAGYTTLGPLMLVTSGNPWQTSSAVLNLPREDFAFGAVGNSIYIIGGYPCSSGPCLEKLDTSVTPQAWQQMAFGGNFTTRFGSASAVSTRGVAGGAIYVFGGQTSTAVDAYNPALNSFASKSPLSSPAHLACATTDASGFIYIIGGSNGGSLAAVNRYDPASDSYVSLSPLPTAVYGPGCAVYNNKIYVFGGFGNSGGTSVTQIYDIASDSWSSGISAPSPQLAYPAAVTMGNTIYVVGGFTAVGAGGHSAQLLAYDPGSNQWITAPPAPSARADAGVVIVNGLLYSFAGIAADNSDSGTTDVFNPALVQYLYSKN